jgi:hypothetical protein
MAHADILDVPPQYAEREVRVSLELKTRLRAEAADHGFEFFGVVDAAKLAAVPFPPNRRLAVPGGSLPEPKRRSVMGMHIWDVMQNAVVTSVLPDGAIPFDDVPGSQYYNMYYEITEARAHRFAEAVRDAGYKAAVTHYQAVVRLQPENVIALNNLAWAAGQLGDPKALDYAQRALRIAPESPLVLDTIGVLLVSSGDTSKGLEYLTRAVALVPDRNDIRLNYAKALVKAGKKDEARKELTQLAAVSQDFSGKAEIPALLKQVQ